MLFLLPDSMLIHFRADDCDLVILNLVSSSWSVQALRSLHGNHQTQHCISLRRMISPSNAEANATGISTFVILILIFLASRGHLIEICYICACRSERLVLLQYSQSSFVITGNPSLIAPAPACQDHIIHRFECIYKCRYTILGICKKCWLHRQVLHYRRSELHEVQQIPHGSQK